MRRRVIQWSTGNVGRLCLRAVLGHPELELAGVWVHSDAKAGRDAGELCGIGRVGVAATSDAEALLAMPADCVVYTATADLRPKQALEEVCRILRSGKNVVTCSLVGLVHPDHLGPEVRRSLDEACRAGGTSFFASGIDPGFANDLLPLLLSGLSERWTELRIREIVNYASYAQAELLFETMGFGKPLDQTPPMLRPETLAYAWGGTLRLLAQGLGLALDEIRSVHESRAAPRELVTPMGTIAPGTRAAVRFEVQGIVGGEPRLVCEHVTRMHDELAPEWPRSAGGYEILIEGVPRMRLVLEMADERGDPAQGGLILTATRLVNAIPAVCAAPPGPMSALDLPLVTGRGLLAC